MDPNELNVRKDRIFDLIVRCYIETAEPVGSRVLSRRSDLGLSPASIRNVMADLEEQGFLRQPHTSAGRVPTDQGYRYWVDSLMGQEELSAEEKEMVLGEIERVRTVEALAERISRLISEMTQNAALVYMTHLKRVTFMNHLLEELVQAQRIAEFLEEEAGLFIEGTSRICGQPEFQDLRKLRTLLEALDEKNQLLQMLLGELSATGVRVRIGRENENGSLEDVSLVVKDCYVGGVPVGGVAVVGPTRMDYPKVCAIVDFVADSVTEAVKRF